jgi:hypothetical protein
MIEEPNDDLQGWIALHRKLLNNPISRRPNYAWLWVVLLLKANHKDHKFIWNNEQQICKRGQVLTGRKKLCEISGISESSIENILTYLKTEHQIEQQKTTKYRLITILNYEYHQNLDIKLNNRVTTEEQQGDTNNNGKNVKKEERDREKAAAIAALALRKINFEKEVREQGIKYTPEMLVDFCRYWTETTRSGVKMKFELQETWSTMGRLATWASKDYNKQPIQKPRGGVVI